MELPSSQVGECQLLLQRSKLGEGPAIGLDPPDFCQDVPSPSPEIIHMRTY